MPTQADILEIKQRHSKQIMQMPGVTGFGVSQAEDGAAELSVYLTEGNQATVDQLPRQIEGIPVRVIATAQFRKFAATRPHEEAA